MKQALRTPDAQTGSIAENFLRDGYAIVDVSASPAFQKTQQTILKEINAFLGTDLKNLEDTHKVLPYEKINDVRLHVYNTLNASPTFTADYFSMFEKALYELLGTELACQNKVNLSIQMPNDPTSTLALHTDTIGGQSQFEVVAWTPFTRAFDTNSMYMFSLADSQEMLMALPQYQTKGMDALLKDWKDKSFVFDQKPGQGIIFSSVLMHGNVMNTTDITRMSMNTRYKALFSPYNAQHSSEKKIGNFYKPLNLSPVTKLALKNKEPHGQFQSH